MNDNLQVMREGLDMGIKAGFAAEARERTVSPEAAGLMGLFNSRTQCIKNKFGNTEKLTKTIGILGAGLMGAGIAEVSIDKGYKTILDSRICQRKALLTASSDQTHLPLLLLKVILFSEII